MGYNKHILLYSVATISLLGSGMAYAGPEGGVVVGGSASISHNGKTTTINQHSDKAIIDWTSFDIGADELTQFNQPGSGSIALNRINDTKASQIDGNLTANGHLILLNQNGVVFGGGARVDVGSLTVSTADIDNEDFMAGRYEFKHAGALDAAIVNRGVITAKEAGLVTFVAPRVENHGIIAARLGKVQLAAADTFTLDMAGDGLIQVEVSQEEAIKLASNSGMIMNDGGVVALTAGQARGLVDSLVDNSGIIEAASMESRGGKIILGGSGTSFTHNSGALDTSGRKYGAQGGEVNVLGDHVALGAGSLIDASGTSGSPIDPDTPGTATMTADKAVRTEEQFLSDHRRGGGSIMIGGDYLGTGDTHTAQTLYVDANALTLNDALDHGDGGRTIFWSDDTTEFNGLVLSRGGALSGNGGFLETSGKINLAANGFADLTASEGFNKGTYLLDPANITIYGNFDPTDIGSLEGWFDADDESTVTLTYSLNGLGGASASGAIGTNTITTSADVSSSLEIGARIRLSGSGAVTTADTLGADTYTITNIVGTTITVAETLSDNYAGESLYRGLVSNLASKAGAENVAQNVETNMPLWLDGALNNRSILSLDGTDDYLSGGDIFDLRTNNKSITSVFNFNDNSSGAVFAKTFYSGANPRYAFFQNAGNVVSLFDISAGNNNVNIAYNSTDYRIADVIIERGVANSVYFEGEFQSSVPVVSDFADQDGINHFFLGAYNNAGGTAPQAGFFLNGHISEVILFNEDIATSDQRLINQYQSAKWGIGLEAPGTGATEADKAMASDGYGVFTTRYLERLSNSADIVLQADSTITLDLDGDNLSLDNGRSITLRTTNGNIDVASAGQITTGGGDITFEAGGTGDINVNQALTLNAVGGGDLTFTTGGVTNNLNNVTVLEGTRLGDLFIAPPASDDAGSTDSGTTDAIPNTVQQLLSIPETQLASPSSAVFTNNSESSNSNNENSEEDEQETADAAQSERPLRIDQTTIDADFVEVDQQLIDFFDLCSYNQSYCE